MMYNTCSVCGNAFLAEGQGPAYRLCANDRDYTPTPHISTFKDYPGEDCERAEFLYVKEGYSRGLIVKATGIPSRVMAYWITRGGWVSKRAAVKSRTTPHADGGLAGAPLAAPSSSPKSLVCAECGTVIPGYSIKPLCVIHLQALKEKEAVA